MRMVRSKGMNLGRQKELGYSEIDSETGEQVAEGTKLHELGTRFNSDKNKLEAEIEKVQASNISAEDKSRIIAQLNSAIDLLQQQYEDDVVAEEEKVQSEIEHQLEQMDEAIDELEEQEDSLRSVTMDAAVADAKAAADEAEEKKQEFIRMKNDYTEKLKLQMEQAQLMQRQIRARRLSGK